MKVYCYHFRARPLPVTVHLDAKDHCFGWRWIVGVQIGAWFVGAINGETREITKENGVRPPQNTSPPTPPSARPAR